MLSTLTFPDLAASPELTLLLDCLKVFLKNLPPSQLQVSRLSSINWPEFESLISAHRLMPVVHQALSQSSLFGALTPSVIQSWMTKQQTMMTRNLHLSSATIKLLRQLEESGIRAIPLKGQLLARQLYNNFTLREPGDIDLLIDPSATERALSLVNELGYRWVDAQQWTPNQQKLMIWKRGEVLCFSSEDKIFVDFHFRWVNNASLFTLDFDHAWKSSTLLKINATDVVRVLNPVHQMLFLSMHGAKHRWERLGWLLDVAMLLTQPQLLSWETLEKEMQTLQIQRPIGQAIRLCHHVLGIEPLSNRLMISDRAAIHYLSTMALHKIYDAPTSQTVLALKPSPLDNVRNTCQQLRYDMSLKPGLFYKLTCSRVLLFRPEDFQVLRLPNSLWFLYIVFRPAFYLWRSLLYFWKLMSKSNGELCQ